MYEPVVGRWMVPDPMRQYWSPYIAFGNNPLNRIDPDGGTDNDIKIESGKCLCSTYDDEFNPITYLPQEFLQAQNIEAGVPLSITSIAMLSAESGPLAAFVAAGGTGAYVGWNIGMNIEKVSYDIGSLLVNLGVPREYLFEPGYGDPNDWVYTIPDPTKPLPKFFEKPDVGNRFPNNNPNVSNWIRYIIYGTGGVEMARKLNNDSPINPKLKSEIHSISFFNEAKYHVRKFIYDFENAVNSGTWYPGR
jgi:hypothetical protein